jgi:glycosyltransferase involved in cell wall biosynthesis
VRGASLPTWDLVVCTVGRTEELDRLLASLQRQTHRGFRVVLVDQNDDDRVPAVAARHPFLPVVLLRSPRGLSRARNAALAQLEGDLVAFPDDDCAYPPDLLERAARRFAAGAALEGVTGRDADPTGRGSRAWPSSPERLTAQNVWYHGLSAAVFLRRGLVERVGPFDERLGLGSGTAWSSGEEVDYLIRAARLGARIEYDPALVVEHEVRDHDGAGLRSIGSRDGGSVGYLLAKHGYPRRTVARMLVRPGGGAALALARRDPERARFHLATLRGRLAGYTAARRASRLP